MVLLCFFAMIPVFFLYMWYIKFIANFVAKQTNYSDFGLFLAIIIGILPIITIIQILVWVGVLH